MRALLAVLWVLWVLSATVLPIAGALGSVPGLGPDACLLSFMGLSLVLYAVLSLPARPAPRRT